MALIILLDDLKTPYFKIDLGKVLLPLSGTYVKGNALLFIYLFTFLFLLTFVIYVIINISTVRRPMFKIGVSIDFHVPICF